MVDEATEPGISDEEAVRLRNDIVDILLSRARNPLPKAAKITPGQAVAFAIRKRLKSEHETAVMNTFVLLDELMRTVPYFYRYVANEKFFRRMWCFVVPDYKQQVKSVMFMIGRPKAANLGNGSRGPNTPSSQRVMILLRAWAEELSFMFHGQYEPDAGFIIERYHNKRKRFPFPDVPESPHPWICPVAGGRLSRRSPRASSSANNPLENMSLDEVENTVRLFMSLVDNANSNADLKKDLCVELAERCKTIRQNLSHLSLNMNEEEELTRAVAISEQLQRALTEYSSRLDGREARSSTAAIDVVSLESEDEGYGDDDRRVSSARSIDARSARSDPASNLAVVRRSGSESGGRRQSRGSLHSDDRGSYNDREHRERRSLDGPDVGKESRNRDRTRSREDERPRERVRARDSERDRSRDREYERDRPERRGSGANASSSRSERKEGSSQGKSTSGVKHSTSKAAVSFDRREKSDSDLPSLSTSNGKRGSGASGTKDNLVDIKGKKRNEDGDGDENRNKESFALLAERYASQNSGRSSKQRGGSSKSKRSAVEEKTQVHPPQSQRPTGQPLEMGIVTGMVPPMVPPGGMFPGAAYQTSVPGVPPMMMNPYGMYGSVNPMGMMTPDNASMFGAFTTVNPAMYYQSMSPGMAPPSFGGMGGGMMGMGMMAPPSMSGNPGMGTPTSPTGADASKDVQGGEGAVASRDMPQLPPMDGGVGGSGMIPMLSPMGAETMMMPASSSGGMAGVPGNDMNGGNMGGASGMMTAKGQAPPQAAVFENAMRQAATAYHMAANAYKTMQGQAEISGASGTGETKSGMEDGSAALGSGGSAGQGQQTG